MLIAVSMPPTEDEPESRAASGPFRDVTEGIWELREAGPPDAERTLLLLAWALASARCYDALVGHSTLTAGSVRLVAATLPGFGRTPAPDDVTVENYGRLAADLAASLGADAVAGHSLGANVALEMALRGGCSGTVRPAVTQLLPKGRVDLPACPGPTGLRARSSPLLPDVPRHRTGDAGEPAARPGG